MWRSNSLHLQISLWSWLVNYRISISSGQSFTKAKKEKNNCYNVCQSDASLNVMVDELNWPCVKLGKAFWITTFLGSLIYWSNKLVTIVEGDPKAPFSIATTPRYRGGRYYIPWIVPLYSWLLPYNAEC